MCIRRKRLSICYDGRCLVHAWMPGWLWKRDLVRGVHALLQVQVRSTCKTVTKCFVRSLDEKREIDTAAAALKLPEKEESPLQCHSGS